MTKEIEKKGGGRARKFSVLNLILVLAILGGFILLAYPSFSNWWNQRHQTRAVAGYVDQVANLSDEENKKLWKAAKAYNADLAKLPMHFELSDQEQKIYDQTLDVTGTGIMGYVQIPKIHVELPIYHGTDPAVLEIAIGHIAGSSLPVGGKSTHCVISGHRGLPSARLFTDLDKMTEGDTFMLQVLGRTLTYEVDQIRIVLPDEVDDMKIEKGKDYCTLVTCTPYGVNTHRLLVRGRRVANDEGEFDVSADATQVQVRYTAPFIAGFIILILILWWIATVLRKKL